MCVFSGLLTSRSVSGSKMVRSVSKIHDRISNLFYVFSDRATLESICSCRSAAVLLRRSRWCTECARLGRIAQLNLLCVQLGVVIYPRHTHRAHPAQGLILVSHRPRKLLKEGHCLCRQANHSLDGCIGIGMPSEIPACLYPSSSPNGYDLFCRDDELSRRKIWLSHGPL
jgi:hypothetical protein